MKGITNFFSGVLQNLLASLVIVGLSALGVFAAGAYRGDTAPAITWSTLLTAGLVLWIIRQILDLMDRRGSSVLVKTISFLNTDLRNSTLAGASGGTGGGGGVGYGSTGGGGGGGLGARGGNGGSIIAGSEPGARPLAED